MKALYWLRNDLRTSDNLAFQWIHQNATESLLFWCESASSLRAGPLRRRFLLESLLPFAQNALLSKQKLPQCLPDLLKIYQPDILIYQTEPGVEETLDQKYAESLAQSHGVKTLSIDGNWLIQPRDLPFAIPQTPERFTHYRKLIEKEPLKVAPKQSSSLILTSNSELLKKIKSQQIEIEPLEELSHLPQQIYPLKGGEEAAHQQLARFVWQADALKTYKETRDSLDGWDNSSKLSPWLSLGCLTARQVYFEVQRYEKERTKNNSTYWLIFELMWRDYFRCISLKWGSKLFSTMSGWTPPSRPSPQTYQAWINGQTEDDLMNALMNQLRLTGWMSNRGRQIAANYMAKQLLLPWQWGAQHFEHCLVDYDVSSNWGNWAYQAGVGQDGVTDRLFNLEIQKSKFDQDGKFRKQWLNC